MKKILVALTAIGVLTSASAFATPIVGTSTGTLSGASGSTTQVTQVHPYQVSWGGPGNQTTLLTAGTAGTDTIDQDYATLGGTGVKIASLTWNNLDNVNGKNVDLNWGVTVTLTDPSFIGPLATNTLSVALKNGTHGDTMLLDSLSGLSLPFISGPWVADNFRYVVNDTVLSNLEWTTVMGTTSTLWIEADFTCTPPDSGPAPVPEPGTMMLLSVGVLGLAVYSKRRQGNPATIS